MKLNEMVEVKHETEKHTSSLNLNQFFALMGIKGDAKEKIASNDSHNTHHHHDHSHSHENEETKDNSSHNHGEEDECSLPECFVKKQHLK